MLDALTSEVRRHWSEVRPGTTPPSAVCYLGLPGSVEGGTTTLLGFVDGARTPSFVVKVHRAMEEADAADSERVVLEALRSRGDFFRSTVPSVLFSGRVAGFPVVVESVLEGSPMPARIAAGGTPDLVSARRHVDLAVDWLIECHRSGPAVPAETAPDWARLALSPIADFEKVFDLSRDEHAHLDDLRARLEVLAAQRVPLCIRHGDFCRHNILVSASPARPRLGIVDWTFSRPVGLPLHDLVFFLATYCLQVRHSSGVQSLDAMFASTFLDANPYSGLVAEGLSRYGRALAIDRPLLAALFEVCLIEQALLEYHRVARALRRGSMPRFTLYLALAERRPWDEAAKAQLWARFFRLFVRERSRFVAA